MQLTDCCRFLICSIRMGGCGVEKFVMNSQETSGGREGGAVHYEFIMYRPPPPSQAVCYEFIMYRTPYILTLRLPTLPSVHPFYFRPRTSLPPTPPPLLFSPSDSPPSPTPIQNVLETICKRRCALTTRIQKGSYDFLITKTIGFLFLYIGFSTLGP